jgi:atypical dual specificity phosphatase
MARILLLLALAACAPADPVGAVPVPGTSSLSEVDSGLALDGASAVDTAVDTPEPEASMVGFSYVRPGIAGMPMPHDADLDFLAAEGVHLVISLTESPVDASALEARGMDALHLPIADFQAPTLEQQRELVLAVQARQDAGEVVAIHCLAGLGRTGTMLATWFVNEGADPLSAIDEVRTLRPGSVETYAQEQAVARYATAMEAR